MRLNGPPCALLIGEGTGGRRPGRRLAEVVQVRGPEGLSVGSTEALLWGRRILEVVKRGVRLGRFGKMGLVPQMEESERRWLEVRLAGVR